MALTKEQVEQLKNQLRDQVKDLPPGQKEQALGQIEAMSNEDVEAMLEQQKSAQAEGGGVQGGGQQKGIFRMIIDGDIPTSKITENDFGLAVISKRALSRGHVLVIPKTAIEKEEDLPKSIAILATEVAKKIKNKLKPEKVEILKEIAFGEAIVNVVPVYDKPVDLKSERREIDDKEIEELFQLLKIVKKKKIEKIKVTTKPRGKPIRLSRRIP